MRKRFVFLLALVLAAGCGGQTTKEIDIATDMAETSDFASADLQRITDGMMSSIAANGFFRRYAAAHAGQKPVMLLARDLLNKTDEHIDTRLILEKIRTRMVNEGLAQFVDDQAFELALDELNLQASDLYDNSKAAKIGGFIGAKYVLRGSISNIRRIEKRENINYVNVTMNIFEVETLLIAWTDEVEFKRVTKRSSLR